MYRMKNNLILMTDGYKPSHSKLYHPETTYMQSYLESRIPKEKGQKVALFGLQYLLNEYFEGSVISNMDIHDAKLMFSDYYGRDDVFDEEGWKYIVNELDGKLPIRIYAQPEGKLLPTRTPLIVVESTDERAFWIVNYFETILSLVWGSSTVATNSWMCKNIIRKYLQETSTLSEEDIESQLLFKLHDFGYRGVSSVETAGIHGLAHLISFRGTDTLRALEFAKYYYSEYNVANSIPATEHSTMTSWGGREGEVKAMENTIDVYSDGVVACVSDSYDIMDAINNKWGGELKDKILERDGTLVVRPDSGDPVVTTEKVVKALWDNFGGTTNDKGYKVLNSKVRMIQGDGIDRPMIEKILRNFMDIGFSAENITFGSGGGLLQKHDRDTFSFAFKCNQVKLGNKEVDVRKFPMEWNQNGEYVQSNKFSKSGDLTVTDGLELVYENGNILKDYTFTDVRNNMNNK